MKIAILCSNLYNLDEKTTKGTEIFAYDLIKNLKKFGRNAELDYTVFASGASRLPFKVESVENLPSSSDDQIMHYGKHIIFELALISKAFSMQNNFDLYHVNIGDGDIILPFTPFVKRPLLITLHHIYDENFTRRYFSYYRDQKNVFFVSISNAQRKILPELNYAATIHHGIDLQEYAFNPGGGSRLIWAGRSIPEKGPDIVIKVAEEIGQEALLFGIYKEDYQPWIESELLAKIYPQKPKSRIKMRFGQPRASLIPFLQHSRLFLFPVQAEEAFGLVLIESLACGTPVVAFARGAVPEIVQDGISGYLVNPSEDDIRGNWVIRQTGFAGLCAAVERIYSLPLESYQQMRRNCRDSVEKNFSMQRMIVDYEELYKKVIMDFGKGEVS